MRATTPWSVRKARTTNGVAQAGHVRASTSSTRRSSCAQGVLRRRGGGCAGVCAGGEVFGAGASPGADVGGERRPGATRPTRGWRTRTYNASYFTGGFIVRRGQAQCSTDDGRLVKSSSDPPSPVSLDD